MRGARYLLGATIALSTLLTTASAAERPNFVVFIADDMAWDDCGAYGHAKIRTPSMDRLADQGLRFDNAFLTCSSCSPSRCSILTGRYPHATGAEELHRPLPADQTTFLDVLREGGYYTASIGKWHLGEDAKRRVDRLEEGVKRLDEKVLSTLRERPKQKPFCLWLAFVDPHRPYAAGAIEKPHAATDAVVPPYLPDVPETRGDLALYYDEIARLDGVVGRTLAELDRQGIADETLILFLSDNGRPFPRCKTTLYDSGIKTPFVVRWPGHVMADGVTDSLVSSVDIAPTLVELAGLTAPATFQGKSFAPILRDPKAETRRYVFADHDWHDFDDHQRAVRSKRYKYLRNDYVDIPLTPPADAVRSPTFRAMRRLRDAGKLSPAQRRVFDRPRPAEELYDVVADPHELRNLARDKKYSEEISRLRSVLDRWRRDTSDPIPPLPRRPDEFDRESGDRLTRR